MNIILDVLFMNIMYIDCNMNIVCDMHGPWNDKDDIYGCNICAYPYVFCSVYVSI